MQADSGSDSDSESRNKNEEIVPVNRLTPTVCTDLPEPATTIRTCAVNLLAPEFGIQILAHPVCKM